MLDGKRAKKAKGIFQGIVLVLARIIELHMPGKSGIPSREDNIDRLSPKPESLY